MNFAELASQAIDMVCFQGNHERINHLVTSCALNVNSRSREAGNR